MCQLCRPQSIRTHLQHHLRIGQPPRRIRLLPRQPRRSVLSMEHPQRALIISSPLFDRNYRQHRP